MDTLYLVIPAYNEEETISAVACAWHSIVDEIGGESRIVIVNDGSRDHTGEILEQLQEKLPRLVPLSKENGGHGAAIAFGYRYAMEHGADYVFQTDSDGQTVPEEFWPFWEARNTYDYQIGHRKRRQDGFARVVVTRVLRLVLLGVFGVWILDANTPFRLMSGKSLEKLLPLLPKNHNLTNVLLSVLYQASGCPGRFLPITFLARQGGVNSINLRRITGIGWTAVWDFCRFRPTVHTLRTQKMQSNRCGQGR